MTPARTRCPSPPPPRPASPATGPAPPAPARQPGPEPRMPDPAEGASTMPADPVKALMHRHRDLCERAVDPLEIAAGLEAHGVTDRTAARFRHRDVFSLAEELYARVPRGEARGRTEPAGPPSPLGARAVAPAVLPGAVALIAVLALHLGAGGARLAVGAAGVVAVAAALSWSLRRGPLRAPGRTVRSARLWVCWLLAYAVCGDGPPTFHSYAPLLGLALAVAPAAWSAHLFSVHARRRLGGSRGLEEFAAGVRPLLLATLALYAAALTALLALTGAPLLPTVALGLLLYLARLLAVHGFAESAATGLAAACAVEALALATVLGGRLPGCGFLARPVEAAVATLGAGAVPAIACGTAALGLLVHATAALSRASAHTSTPAEPTPRAYP
ncbi:hypothetical protein [Streptomyces sp. NPDC000410]|uniref:hypothetical protein n=1 Tax=Streptomyces sp. NPDC000410 TaxID=3154254 RepID=UPI00332B17ED